MPGSAKTDTQSSNQPNPKPPLTLLSGGLFAAFLAALIAAPNMGGVTGPFWVHMMVALIILFGTMIIWYELIPHWRVHHKILSTVFITVLAVAYDRWIVASKKATAVMTESQQGQSGVERAPISPEGPRQAPSPSPGSNASLIGRWKGRMQCRWHSDDLSWTFERGEGSQLRVTEIWRTSNMGLGPNKPVTYTASQKGDKVHLVVDPQFGHYEISLVENADGRELVGHYLLHGSCDHVAMQRETDDQ